MKTGQQVHLRFNPDAKGTISAVESDRVRITWPQRWAVIGKDKSVRLPRERTWYAKADIMKVLGK